MESGKITVLIADDHLLFRTGLKALLSGLPEVELIGEAANGQELMEKTTQLNPDLIITDLDMPVMSGLDATRELFKRDPYCRILCLSVHGNEETILRMIEAGALGYLIKSAGPEEIREAIYSAQIYKPFFCKKSTGMLTDIVSRHVRFPPKPPIFFTDREKEIIQLICEEQTSKAIAAILNLSTRTIEGHRTRIMDKIGAKSVAGIIAYAFAHGLNRKKDK